MKATKEQEIDIMIEKAKKLYEIPDDVQAIKVGSNLGIRYARRSTAGLDSITIVEYGIYIDPIEQTMDVLIISWFAKTRIRYKWDGRDWIRQGTTISSPP